MAYPISDVTRRVVYTGSAGVGPYSFTFEVLANTDIQVYKNTTLLTLTTNYTVTINSNGTGSVTLVVAATGADTITIVGDRAIQRATDFVTGGDLFANTLNDEFDSLVIFAQQVDEKADRGLKAPVTDPTDVNMVLPVKATRLGTVLAFNATTGNPEAGPSIGSVTTVAAQSANINTVATNIASVNTVAGNNTNVTTVAGVSSAVTTVAGISSNVTSVAGNASNINTVAGNNANVTAVGTISSNVTTVAGISANVTTVAGISSNVTTVAGVSAAVTTNATNISSINTNATNIVAIQNASTNATNAAASAVSAGNAQTAAEAARDATLTAYDNFDDRYLGSKTSNPTLDNDGNALVAGSLYFNSVSGAMQVYTGSAWVAAYVSGTGFLASANNLSDVASTSSARTNLGLGTAAVVADSTLVHTSGNETIAGTKTFSAAPIYSSLTASSAVATDASKGLVSVTNTGTGNNVLATSPTITTPTISSLSSASATALTLQSAGTTAVTVDTSQNVGIGTASPSSKLHVAGGSSSTIKNTASAGSSWFVGSNVDSYILHNESNTPMVFTTNATERMRIDSNGNVGIGATPVAMSNNNGLQVSTQTIIQNVVSNQSLIAGNAYYSGSWKAVRTQVGYAAVRLNAVVAGAISFHQSNSSYTAGDALPNMDGSDVKMTIIPTGQVGINVNPAVGNTFRVVAISSDNSVQFGTSGAGVYLGNGATSFSTYSDTRLKNITGKYETPLLDVAKLEAIKFTWKNDTGNKPCVGVSAQSVETVIPEAIDRGTNFNVEGDTTEYLSVRYTELIPLMIASIQELKQINDTQAETINALTARITALENA